MKIIKREASWTLHGDFYLADGKSIEIDRNNPEFRALLKTPYIFGVKREKDSYPTFESIEDQFRNWSTKFPDEGWIPCKWKNPLYEKYDYNPILDYVFPKLDLCNRETKYEHGGTIHHKNTLPGESSMTSFNRIYNYYTCRKTSNLVATEITGSGYNVVRLTTFGKKLVKRECEKRFPAKKIKRIGKLCKLDVFLHSAYIHNHDYSYK